MSLLRRARHLLGSNPLLHRTFRYWTGQSGPRWHLEISFRARDQSWNCRSHPCYQTRGLSTLQLITQAMESIRGRLQRDFKVVAWLGDMPPEWYFAGPHLAYARSDEQTKTTLIPDFAFQAWPEAGIADYEAMADTLVEASRRPVLHRGVFWIGAAYKHPSRMALIEQSLAEPRIVARAVEWIGDGQDAPDHLLPTKGNNFVSLPDHCDYQYLIDLQGGGFSARVKLLLFSGRPLFLQERRWKEFYYQWLQPFVHYIPVKEDLSDLSAQLDWADAHPVQVAEIAQAAQAFAQQRLRRAHAVEQFRELFARLGDARPAPSVGLVEQ